jgi:hypothetical protein
MGTVSYRFTGINNVEDPVGVDNTEAVSIVNADPDYEGNLSLRPGQLTVLAGSYHSGWSNPYNPREGYFINGTLLNRLNLNGSITPVRFDMIPNIPVAFCQVNDVVAYSNGLLFGVIENGVDTVPFFPVDQFKERMVAGTFMEWYNGRLYALVDNYAGTPGCALICSDAMDVPGGIESMDTRQNVVAVFEGKGAGMIRIESRDGGGLFVGTDRESFWLDIDDPVADGGIKSQKSVAPYGMIPGTILPVKAELLGIQGLMGNACLFATPRGICAGGNGGFFSNLTEKKISYQPGERGCAVLREVAGLVHYLLVMQGTGDAYNPFTSDGTDSVFGRIVVDSEEVL